MIRSSLIKSGKEFYYKLFLKSSSNIADLADFIVKFERKTTITFSTLIFFCIFLPVFKNMTSESSIFGRRALSSEAMSQFKTLKIVEEKEFVYNVQMNREKKLNALNTVMWL